MRNGLLFALLTAWTASTLALATAPTDADALFGVFCPNIGHAHPPEIPVLHQLASVSAITGAQTDIGSPTVSGAIGQQTGEVWGDSLYTLEQFYNGTTLVTRVAQRSTLTGAVVKVFPFPEVPFMLWTGFGQQMVINELDHGGGIQAVVLAPTVNLGNYNFNMTLFVCDLDGSRAGWTRLLAELGAWQVTPTLAAGYNAARVGLGQMFVTLATPAGTPILLVILMSDGRVLRRIASPTAVFAKDGNWGLFGAGGGVSPGGIGPPGLYFLEQDAHEFKLLRIFPELGSTWELAPPAIATFVAETFSSSAPEGALYVTAVDKSDPTDPKAINTVALLALPTNQSQVKPHVVRNFCTLSGGGFNYTCPKLLTAFSSTTLRNSLRN